MATIRTVISIVAAKQWLIHQMDVHNTFLQGYLYEEVYMHTDGTKKQVWRLLKSLYGLKQALRQWNHKLTTAFVSSGFAKVLETTLCLVGKIVIR